MTGWTFVSQTDVVLALFIDGVGDATWKLVKSAEKAQGARRNMLLVAKALLATSRLGSRILLQGWRFLEAKSLVLAL